MSDRRRISFDRGHDEGAEFESSELGLTVSLRLPGQVSGAVALDVDQARELAEFILESEPDASTTTSGDLIRTNYRLVRAIERALEEIYLSSSGAVGSACETLRRALPAHAESPYDREPGDFERRGINYSEEEWNP